jgi:hypothetical protein
LRSRILITSKSAVSDLLERLNIVKLGFVVFFSITFFTSGWWSVESAWEALGWITKPWWSDWSLGTGWSHGTSVSSWTSFTWPTVFTDTWNTGLAWKTWWTWITSNGLTCWTCDTTITWLTVETWNTGLTW